MLAPIQPNQQRCVTCQYWQGGRRIKTLNSVEKCVEPLSPTGQCPMFSNGKNLNYNQTPPNCAGCSYKRWIELP